MKQPFAASGSRPQAASRDGPLCPTDLMAVSGRAARLLNALPGFDRVTEVPVVLDQTEAFCKRSMNPALEGIVMS